VVHPAAPSYLKKPGSPSGSKPLLDRIKYKRNLYNKKGDKFSVAARAGASFTTLGAESYGFLHKDYIDFLRKVAEEALFCGLIGEKDLDRYHFYLIAEASVCIQRGNSVIMSNFARSARKVINHDPRPPSIIRHPKTHVPFRISGDGNIARRVFQQSG
jgi:hypothetical protein